MGHSKKGGKKGPAPKKSAAKGAARNGSSAGGAAQEFEDSDGEIAGDANWLEEQRRLLERFRTEKEKEETVTLLSKEARQEEVVEQQRRLLEQAEARKAGGASLAATVGSGQAPGEGGASSGRSDGAVAPGSAGAGAGAGTTGSHGAVAATARGATFSRGLSTPHRCRQRSSSCLPRLGLLQEPPLLLDDLFLPGLLAQKRHRLLLFLLGSEALEQAPLFLQPIRIACNLAVAVLKLLRGSTCRRPIPSGTFCRTLLRRRAFFAPFLRVAHAGQSPALPRRRSSHQNPQGGKSQWQLPCLPHPAAPRSDLKSGHTHSMQSTLLGWARASSGPEAGDRCTPAYPCSEPA
mmetsp:Transcript_85849/g.241562  ORF Transcript_85849/g.241562 Transcript_85849/m.241562 type:complete len:348 (+) Transcript_85849:236-1279(+)